MKIQLYRPQAKQILACETCNKNVKKCNALFIVEVHLHVAAQASLQALHLNDFETSNTNRTYTQLVNESATFVKF